MANPDPSSDPVRMRGFARRSTVAEALLWLDAQLAPRVEQLDEELVPLAGAAGRVLSREVTSPVSVPGFRRAMMDGFALRAADTLGASPYSRLELPIVGGSLPGRAFPGRLSPGQAVEITTGAPLPEGADAVLPAELVEIAAGRILAHGEVSPGKHVGEIGEDILAGAAVLPARRRLRPQDVGVLSSIGLAQVPVVRRPRVQIVVTGDELLPAGSVPSGHRIADSNGPMLSALVARDGGMPIQPGIVPDRPEAILAALRGDCPDFCGRTPQKWDCPLSAPRRPAADVVLVSGGSSVGSEDHAPGLLRQHGELPIHGLAMRPSSPAGMGRLEGRLVFLLPGNPVSCLCAYDFFAGRAIRVLGGRRGDWPYRRVRLPLARKIVSVVGRLDYLRVRIEQGQVVPLSIGGASILSSTSRADGFVLVPADSEGQPPGAEVEVFLYEQVV